MDEKKINSIMAKHVKAKLDGAMALDMKATWRTEDHLRAMTEVLCECVKDAVEPEEVLQVVKATYNVSQFQQKLERDFKATGTGHFQRSAKPGTEKDVGDLIVALARETARAKSQGSEGTQGAAPEGTEG